VVTVVNPRPIHPVDFTGSGAGYPNMEALLEHVKGMSAKTYVVEATEEAQKLGNPMLANMILIGALIGTGLVTISREAIEKTIKDMFPKSVTENIAALSKGRELAAGNHFKAGPVS
jgi:indolepyruvate ferredoxin oxidoreductase beta subunit